MGELVVNKNHAQYLENMLGFKRSANPKGFDECLRTMEIYEKRGNHWWVDYQNDDVQLAFYQLKEPILLIPSDVLRSGIKKVVNHNVELSEISQSNKALIKEFYDKFPHFIATYYKGSSTYQRMP